MKGKRSIKTLSRTIVFLIMFSLLSWMNAMAQDTVVVQPPSADAGSSSFAEKINLAVGGGLALLYHEPEEEDLDKDGTPLDIYANFEFAEMLKFRAGINMASSKISYSGGEEEVSTTSLYGAYRFQMEIVSDVQLFALGGLAYVMSEAMDENDSSFGYIMGGGGLYELSVLNLDQVSVGAQFIYISSESESDGVTVATGSNQIQITGQYQF
jgi:hypothetical protein